VVHSRVVVVGFILTVLVAISGCIGLEKTVESMDQGQARVSFSEEQFNLGRPVHIGIQIESLGNYDFIWIEPDGIKGGYQINRSSERPVLYISDYGFRTTSLGICYKTSRGSDCSSYAGDPTRLNPTVEVYGIKERDKKLIGRYSLTTPMKEVSYNR
jgi:hypothetical protein